MTVERVNPELLLKCAQLARPELPWFICPHTTNRIRHRTQLGGSFDPLTSDDDAMKLERALKREGWNFGYWHPNTVFIARPESSIYSVILDKSDTILLLKVVAHQFSIPLYQESK